MRLPNQGEGGFVSSSYKLNLKWTITEALFLLQQDTKSR